MSCSHYSLEWKRAEGGGIFLLLKGTTLNITEKVHSPEKMYVVSFSCTCVDSSGKPSSRSFWDWPRCWSSSLFAWTSLASVRAAISGRIKCSLPLSYQSKCWQCLSQPSNDHLLSCYLLLLKCLNGDFLPVFGLNFFFNMALKNYFLHFELNHLARPYQTWS